MSDQAINQMLAEWSCAKAMHKYAAAADGDDINLFLDAFTPDGAWERPDGQVVRGHSELKNFYVGRPRGGFSRHILSNIVVTVQDHQRARGTSVAVVLKSKGPVALPLKTVEQVLVGNYEDEFQCCSDGQWRITRRRVTLQLDTLQP